MNLHILKYNNYFNRFMKREANLDGYLAEAELHHVVAATNFNENDGVSAVHVVNFSGPVAPFEGDYAILEEDGQIISRWFVLENQWTRKGQYRLTLRRDLVVDYFSDFADSAFYIRHGYPDGIDDPAIWNTDPVSFNEIRKGVRLLRDPTRTSWAVLYVQPFLGEKQYRNPDPDDVLVPWLWPKVTKDINGKIKIGFGANRIRPTAEQPYSILAIPLDTAPNVTITLTDGKNMSPDVNTISLIQGLCESLGSFLYDAQILPYSPFGAEYYRSDGKPGLANVDPDSFILERVPVDPKSEEMTDVPLNLPILRVDDATVIHEGPWGPTVAIGQGVSGYKTVNQLYKWRISDGFGAGSFEYNIAKNRFNQNIKLIQTCKPFQPLVAVIPEYDDDGLYGNDAEEKRGMISRGPYTMPRMSDAWINYAQNNINYQKSFDRSITTLEINNALGNMAADTAALLGVGSSAISGMTQGAFVGGPVGAVAGGVISAAGSFVGAAMDRSLRLAAQREHIANAREQFAYSIGNIKARPDSLASLSSFDAISSISPYVETFTCTDAERDWYFQHLEIHGCAINRLGTFRQAADVVVRRYASESITRFVSGTLMRCDLPDPHMAMELAQELERGVYIYVDSVTN